MTNKIKIALMVLGLYSQFQSCSSGRVEPIDEQRSRDADTVKPQAASGISPWQLVDTIGLKCSTDVTVFSRDSVIAIVRLKNTSNSPIELFKPLLPMDSAAGNSFVVLDKNYNNVNYKKSRIPINPRLLDSISSNDILTLVPGGEIVYKINLSSDYDFRSGNRLFIDYYNLFPFLVNARHVLDTSYGFARPVWFSVTSVKKDSSGHLIRNQINLPKY